MSKNTQVFFRKDVDCHAELDIEKIKYYQEKDLLKVEVPFLRGNFDTEECSWDELELN